MSKLLENPSTLCRVCLNEGVYNIKDKFLQLPDEEISGEFMLGYFSSLENNNIESIPSLICEQCLSELIQSFLFFNKVKNADENINLACMTPLTEDEDTQEFNTEIESLNSKSDNDSNMDFLDVIELVENKYESDVNKLSDEDQDNINKINTMDDTEHIIKQSPKNESYLKQCSLQTTKYNKSKEFGGVVKKRKKVYKKVLDLFDEFCNEDVNVEGNSFVVGKFKPSANNEILDIKGPNLSTNTRTFNYSPVVLEYTDSFELNGEDQADIDNDDQSVIYKCQFCPKAFSSSHFLISHLSKAHVCTQCTECFKKTSDLFEHVRSSHKVYKCAICNREFKCNSNLRQHIKNAHKLTLPPYVSLLAFNRQGEEDMWLPENVKNEFLK